MHGLTGGSWKRSNPAKGTTKNDPRETARITVASRPTAGNCHRASSRPSTSIRRLRCWLRRSAGRELAGGGSLLLGTGWFSPKPLLLPQEPAVFHRARLDVPAPTLETVTGGLSGPS